MAKQTVQRIKLRCDGSPVKLDATIVKSSPDAKVITVQFDGPMEDVTLYAYGATTMASHLVGKDGVPTTEFRLAVSSRLWHVL